MVSFPMVVSLVWAQCVCVCVCVWWKVTGSIDSDSALCVWLYMVFLCPAFGVFLVTTYK